MEAIRRSEEEEGWPRTEVPEPATDATVGRTEQSESEASAGAADVANEQGQELNDDLPDATKLGDMSVTYPGELTWEEAEALIKEIEESGFVDDENIEQVERAGETQIDREMAE